MTHRRLPEEDPDIDAWAWWLFSLLVGGNVILFASVGFPYASRDMLALLGVWAAHIPFTFHFVLEDGWSHLDAPPFDPFS